MGGLSVDNGPDTAGRWTTFHRDRLPY